MKTITFAKTTCKILLSLAFALPATSMANTNPGSMQWDDEYFTKIDTDKDGRISLEEYEVFMNDAFSKLDKDKNGSLTRAETADKLTEEQFSFLDKNKDNRIELDEFLDQLIAEFKRNDRNNDGYLTPR